MANRRRLRKAEKKIDNVRKNGTDDVFNPTIDGVIDNRITNIPEERNLGDAIGEREIKEAAEKLLKFKAGKVNLENRIIQNEQWWKGRHWDNISASKRTGDEPTSAWLFNCIMSKYADYMDAYPEPNILPREEGDVEEAERLTHIIPVVLEQNGFYKIYSNEAWKKLKDGSGIYGVFWDGKKLNGLGDISIQNIDFLNLFWEPGITDIQDSSDVFHVNLFSNKTLETMYPQLKGKLAGESFVKSEYIYEDYVDTEDKSLVVDWYYKKWDGEKNILHYCKFVNNVVIFASENEVERPTETVYEDDIDENGNPFQHEFEVETGEESISEKGWYEHGKYPFVVDTMFPVEGSLCGFSYIDVCKNPQEYIDRLDQAVLKNAQMNAIPRYFMRNNSGVNEEEFLDWSKPIVHVAGDISDTGIRKIDAPDMNGSAMTKINDKINEMKETTGNTDVARGNIGGGITSGSAISALQESAGKTSRSQNQMAYQAYQEVITIVIELIREFYDAPRQFRIIGENGPEFTSYSNKNLQPQKQGNNFDIEDGYRLPVFDIEVNAQKQNPYSKNSQNELALQLYGAGFFAPQNGDVALACLEVMDFKRKQDVLNKIKGNAQLYNENMQLKQQMIQMAATLDQMKGTSMVQDLQQAFGSEMPIGAGGNTGNVKLEEESEHPFNERAREQAQNATQVN